MAFDAFALILTLLLLGMLFARLRVFPDNAADVLNRVVLYVCLPAAVLTYVPRLRLDATLAGVIVTPWLLTVAKIIGGAYILYLGVSLLRSRPKTVLEGEKEEHEPPVEQTLLKAFTTGFLTNATNPKATLFFLAIFTTLISTSTPLGIQALYGLWMCFVNALWFVIVALFFSSNRVRVLFMRMGHWFERTMGVVLILFAGRLILSM